MFERNKIDNVDQSAIPVEITCDDDTVQKGRLMIAVGRNIFDVLNSPGAFLDFEPYGGERTFVAKTSVRHVKLINVPRAPNLAQRARDLDGFDPHSILGLVPTATLEETKTAWHALSKSYHPDRYASAELPDEVRDYLAAMARRINAAYKALETQLVAQKRNLAGRSAPIYTSDQRRA